MQAIDQTVPLAVTMSESVTRLRQWAKGRARPAGGNDRMRSRTGRRLAA
jgi:DNA-binding transcriptional regulator YiaG